MRAKKTKVLLIEDSLNLRLVLKDYLEMMGYEVADFGDCESALKNFKPNCCEICLLDIGLPRKDGYVVIKELRDVSPYLPVIFVTAKDTKEDRIKGFRAGCDDYVTKPFSTEELLLRMEAVLKRYRTSNLSYSSFKEIIFHIGDFLFDYCELTLTRNGEVRRLTRKEAQLLKIMYERQNKLVPRELLLKEIWGDTKAAEGRSLDVFLSKLRIYLRTEEDGRPKVDLINVHGVGYLLKVDL
jgi:DNA-binding response OmpR family regulator